MSPSGTITQYPLPDADVINAITAGPDGALWFTAALPGVFGGNPTRPEVGMVTQAGAIQIFPLPVGQDPGAITTGPDGNLWVTPAAQPSGSGSVLDRITPTGILTTAAPVDYNGGLNLSITSIAVGPDGAVWYIDAYRQQIDRVAP
jgi:virginiamycin B lyase